MNKNIFKLLSIFADLDKPFLTNSQTVELLEMPLDTINKSILELQKLGYIDKNSVNNLYITQKGLLFLEQYKVKTAIILAAGFGNRLLPVTLETPKPLITVNGKPMIETVIESLQRVNIEKIYIVVGYKKELFYYLKDKYKNINIIFNKEYKYKNNISSLYSAINIFELGNCCVCEGDMVINDPNIFIKYFYLSFYMSKFIKGKTDEWCFKFKNSLIKKIEIGGSDKYTLVGISYWTPKDAKIISNKLREAYTNKCNDNLYWDSIVKDNIDNIKIGIKKVTHNQIIEIDTIVELIEQDKSYDKYLLKNNTEKITQDVTINTVDEKLLKYQIIHVIENNYDLGKVISISELLGGYINRSFNCILEKDRCKTNWFVRKYKKNKKQSEILFEHNLLFHIHKSGFNYAPVPVCCKDGKSFVELEEGAGNQKHTYFFAMFTFLDGDDKFNWMDNLPEQTYLNLAKIIAKFHNSVKDFITPEIDCQEVPILDMAYNLKKELKLYLDLYTKNSFSNKYFEYLKNNLKLIEDIASSIQIEDKHLKKMPYIPIHCDLHAGNFKYNGNDIIGIFDFDWAKIDLRIFELGICFVYCFSSWNLKENGVINIEACKKFTIEYNKELEKLSGLSPITDIEKKYMPEILLCGNLFLISWCSKVVYNNYTLSTNEYLYYMQHHVKSLFWIFEHKEEIRNMFERI